MKECFYSLLLMVAVGGFYACSDNESGKEEPVDMTTDCRTAIETGAYSIWYKPANGWVGDPIPFYDNGTFYVFYLQDWRSGYPFLHPWHMVSTTDFSSWAFGGEIIPCGEEDQQDVALGTGGVIKDRETGEYCAFYTGHQWNWEAMGVPTQAILLTTSKDLKTWTKKGEDKFYLSLRGQSGYVENDCRDPHVFYDESDGLYKMVVTTHTDAGATLALLTTKTLQDASSWKLQKPLYTDPSIWVMECADVFKEGKYWYLTFSNVADRKVHYRYAESLDGNWITPEHDIFDGLAYYAAKTMSNGAERYLAGWVPTRIGNDGADDQWGGSLVVHRMVFNDDGTIDLKLVDGIGGKFTVPKENVAVAGLLLCGAAGTALPAGLPDPEYGYGHPVRPAVPLLLPVCGQSHSRCAVHDRHSRGSIGTGCGLLHPVPPGFPGLRCEPRTHSAEFSLLFHPDKLSADPLSAVYVNLAFHTPVSGFLPEPAYFTW